MSSSRFCVLRSWLALPCLTGVLLGAALGGLPDGVHAEGVTAIAPPATYPATTWQGRSGAVLRIMRRLDSHVEQVPLQMGEEVQYGPLSLRLERCLQKPAGLPAESAALLHIEEKQDASSPAFEGWMFTDDPALGAYAGALYDVQVITCAGGDVAPMAGPLPSPVVPHLPAIMAPHVEADEGRDGGIAGQGAQPSGSAGQENMQGNTQGSAGSAGGEAGPLSLLPPAAPAPAQPVPAPQAPESAPR